MAAMAVAAAELEAVAGTVETVAPVKAAAAARWEVVSAAAMAAAVAPKAAPRAASRVEEAVAMGRVAAARAVREVATRVGVVATAAEAATAAAGAAPRHSCKTRQGTACRPTRRAAWCGCQPRTASCRGRRTRS